MALLIAVSLQADTHAQHARAHTNTHSVICLSQAEELISQCRIPNCTHGLIQSTITISIKTHSSLHFAVLWPDGRDIVGFIGLAFPTCVHTETVRLCYDCCLERGSFIFLKIPFCSKCFQSSIARQRPFQGKAF